jgi:hypothetical protein
MSPAPGWSTQFNSRASSRLQATSRRTTDEVSPSTSVVCGREQKPRYRRENETDDEPDACARWSTEAEPNDAGQDDRAASAEECARDSEQQHEPDDDRDENRWNSHAAYDSDGLWSRQDEPDRPHYRLKRLDVIAISASNTQDMPEDLTEELIDELGWDDESDDDE